ncbi:MAG: DUF1049 domain-containing protein [Deltaproteobacteria bacterium]|nr:DUF1049 domain-containing protein [Deltaproteobacteria bacterium]MBW2137094.1 DUF1049 domain-containing protein [Deltaproteobacteria bacterium]
MKHIKFIVAILLMLIVVILIVQNHEAMSTTVMFRIKFFSHEVRTSMVSLYYIVTIAFLFGVVVMGIYGMVERFRLKRQIKILMETNQEKEKELNSLRNLPITSDEVSTFKEVDTQ